MIARATLLSATLGEDGMVEPPLGALYIAAALERDGWAIDFRDYQLHPNASCFDPDLICDCLAGHEDVLLISCFVDMLPAVIAAAGKIKAARSGAYIVLGGPGPTGGANKLMEIFESLDAIVLGEGEETIREWASHYLAGSLATRPIAGMVHRYEGMAIAGPARARIWQAESIAPPAYHHLDWSKYSAARVVTTRGCPYHCSFCDVAPLWGRRAVYRELHDIIDEIEHLYERHGQAEFAISDDTFVLNRDRVRQFCELMLERRLSVRWGCFGRINLMSEDLMELMARAGCGAVFYGIDSGSPAVLKRTFKELDPEIILPTVQTSSRYFAVVEASFIWGYPFETYEDFLSTLDLACAVSQFAPRVNVQLHMLSPLPSSPIFETFKGELQEPEAEDRPWLLLPALRTDPKAAGIRGVIDQAPRLFPGFFSFPTPDKQAKRARLQNVRSALHATIGRSLTDVAIRRLLAQPDEAVEQKLLAEAATPEERIGVGLALGRFRRVRWGNHVHTPGGLSGRRGAAMARQRNDLMSDRAS
jgi:anaerobic magnesium-protoporphyrin IX monomethyl ester cyclase